MANLLERIIPWFRLLTDREPLAVDLSPEARQTRLGSKGILFARLDRPAAPRGRRASKRDLQANPLITVAFYGPDDTRATKLAVTFVGPPGSPEDEPARWVSADVLGEGKVLEETRAFLVAHPALGITVTGGTVGCPHEEGEDFSIGTDCPLCPFWKGKQRS